MSDAALKTYAAALRRWNQAVNLVSPSTLDDLESRHIQDSLQLARYMPDHSVHIMDWGSGAGLPGFILALARPHDIVHLVESDQKKAEFLRHVSRETKREVYVHNIRLEDITPDEFPVDVITSRALMSLKSLFSHMCTYQKVHPQLFGLFPKGRRWRDEVAEAKKSFLFNVIDHPSEVDSEGRILVVKGLTKRTEEDTLRS